ncbi:hypothetical protein [Clavibacter michiganensis]|uniref:hypothetical protein n=1 Tax=Clavibacter michiganensis TaxID=28447 RepID=UPI00068D646B|nr:hypothetical protein [Clavibacter michiganensis]
MEPHERADPGAGPVEPARAELAELRRRAYGPGRDADPADLDRLRVLEERAAARPAAPGPSAVEAAPADPASPAVVDHDDEASVHPDPVRPRPRRRLAVLWAASLVAAVALTAVVVSSLTAPAGREVAVVRFDPDQELPVYMRDYFGGAETGSARFHGLTLVRLENDRSAYPQVRAECLSVQPSRAALGSTEGGGCAAGAFGASAQFVVNAGAPEELRDVYPVGTALFFDLRGDAVHVRVDDSARVPSPTRPPT